MNAREILDGWKAISDYLKRDKRTCQRWERELGLPVHRLDRSLRARVFAYPDELDAWLAKKPLPIAGLLGRLLDLVRSNRWGVAAALILVFLSAWRIRTSRDTPNDLTIVVLPFQSIAGRPDTVERAATALPQLLVQGLSGSSYFKVLPFDEIAEALRELGIARGAPYSAEDLRRIGRKTGASYAVSGALIEDADRLVLLLSTREIVSGEVQSSRFECARDAPVVVPADLMADRIKCDLGLSRSAQSGDFDAPAVPITTSSLKAFRLYNEGRRLHIRAKYARSAKLMRRAIKYDPGFAMAWRSLGASFASSGDRVQANECYRKAIDLSHNASKQEQFFIRTSYWQNLEEYANSLHVLREWSAKYPDDTQALLLTGRALLFEEEAEAASLYLLEALRKGDQNPFTFYYAALARAAVGRPEEAEKIVEQGLSVHPRNLLITAAGFANATFQGRYDQALRMLEEVQQHEEPDPGIEYRYGNILLLKGDFRGAERHYSAIRPISPRFKCRLAALALAEGRYGRAADLAREAGDHALLSYVEWRRGNLSAALEEVEGALAEGGYSSQTYSGLFALLLKGTIEASKGDIEAAKATEAQIREKSRTGLEKCYLRAAGYLRGLIAVSEGRDEVAAEEFAVVLDSPYGNLPDLEDMPYMLGVTSGTCALIIDTAARHREKVGDDSGALALYLKLTDLHGGRLQHPDLFALAHYSIGRIRQVQGDVDGANWAFTKFLDLWKNADPGLPEVEDAKARLASL